MHGQGDGEVPWRDGADHAQRVIAHQHTPLGLVVAQHLVADRDGRQLLHVVGRDRQFEFRLFQRLAVLLGQQGSDVGGGGDHAVSEVGDQGAAVLSRAGPPGGGFAARGGNGVIQILLCRGRAQGEGTAGGGIDDLIEVRACAQLSIDQMALNRRRQGLARVLSMIFLRRLHGRLPET
ncbi:hypothetical protein D3C72_1410200 [compost metagenome]